MGAHRDGMWRGVKSAGAAKFDTDAGRGNVRDMKAALVLSAAALLLCSCRTKPPVVRHFLRMPPECTGGLSSLDRAQWLKENRKSLPDKRTLAATGHLELKETVTGHGTAIRSLQMLHMPGTNRTAGGIAVVTVSGESAAATPRVRLLEHRAANYVEVTGSHPAARAAGISKWILNAADRTATGCIEGDGLLSPKIEFHWNGQAWKQRPPQGSGWRVAVNASQPPVTAPAHGSAE